MNILTKTGLTQADGAETFDLKEENAFATQQLQIEVSAQPTVGTLAIAAKSPGGTVFSVLDSTIDMTVLTATNAKIVQIDVLAEAIKITPTGFDAGKTYNAILVSK